MPLRQTPSSTVAANVGSTTTAFGTEATRKASLTEARLTDARSANAAPIMDSGVVGRRTICTPPRVWAAA